MSSCLRTGLCSALSARLSDSGDVYIDLGESLRHALDTDGRVKDLRHVRLFVTDALAEVRPYESKESYEAVLAVDSKIEDIRKTIDPLVDKFRVVSLADLPHPLPELFSLSVALRYGHLIHGRYSTQGAFTNGQPCLYGRTLDKVAAVVEVLDSVDVRLAGAYLLLLTSSHVVKYSYILRRPDEQEDVEAAVQICVRATAGHFAQRFPSWLARTMETPEARLYLDTMVVNLNTLAASTAFVTDAFPINESELGGMRVGTISTDVPDREEHPLTDDDFLLYVIQRSKELLPDDWPSVDRAVQQQLRGDTVEENHTVIVPSLYLTADLLRPEASEETLDYSTVGVRLLAVWATMAAAGSDRGSHANATSVTDYRKCVEHHAADTVSGDLSQGALRFVLFLLWALDVALMAATHGKGNGGEFDNSVLMAKQRVFFRRFCLTACGDPEAAGTCRYGVLHSDHFARAFGCTRPPLHVPC